MTDRIEPEEKAEGGSAGDRRGRDRRSGSRRTPVPLWRRPPALVAFGVVGALLLVMVIQAALDDPEEERSGPMDVTTTAAPPGVDPNGAPSAGSPLRDAYGVGDFERLLAEGDAAAGQRVRTLLYCEPTGVVALTDAERVHASVAALAGTDRRVPAADCKWSAEEGAPDFLLLVPPQLAQRFASTPEVEQGFVRRRRVQAEVEWLGRPDALSLRTAGVLRSVTAP